jgi:hypothetical protein
MSKVRTKEDHPWQATQIFYKSTYGEAVAFIEQQDYDSWFVLSAKISLRKYPWKLISEAEASLC